jgi:hypothetical protein
MTLKYKRLLTWQEILTSEYLIIVVTVSLESNLRQEFH